jgi:hypothetical protein
LTTASRNDQTRALSRTVSFHSRYRSRTNALAVKHYPSVVQCVPTRHPVPPVSDAGLLSVRCCALRRRSIRKLTRGSVWLARRGSAAPGASAPCTIIEMASSMRR